MQKQDYQNLRECPFCGGEAKMQFGWPAQQKKQKMVFVKCKSCGCKTKTVYQMAYQAWDDCKRYAVEAWNRRVQNE